MQSQMEPQNDKEKETQTFNIIIKWKILRRFSAGTE